MKGAIVGEPLVGLADAVEALRDELLTAMKAGTGSAMQFALEPIELTVQVVVTKDGQGKLGWKILEFGGSYETARTQSVTLKLTPLWRDQEGGLTKDFTIAAVGQPGDHFGKRA